MCLFLQGKVQKWAKFSAILWKSFSYTGVWKKKNPLISWKSFSYNRALSRDTKSRLLWAKSWCYRNRRVPRGRLRAPSAFWFMILLLVVSASYCNPVSHLYVVLQRIDGIYVSIVICPRFVYRYLLCCDGRSLSDSMGSHVWYDSLFPVFPLLLWFIRYSVCTHLFAHCRVNFINCSYLSLHVMWFK